MKYFVTVASYVGSGPETNVRSLVWTVPNHFRAQQNLARFWEKTEGTE